MSWNSKRKSIFCFGFATFKNGLCESHIFSFKKVGSTWKSWKSEHSVKYWQNFLYLPLLGLSPGIFLLDWAILCNKFLGASTNVSFPIGNVCNFWNLLPKQKSIFLSLFVTFKNSLLSLMFYYLRKSVKNGLFAVIMLTTGKCACICFVWGWVLEFVFLIGQFVKKFFQSCFTVCRKSTNDSFPNIFSQFRG